MKEMIEILVVILLFLVAGLIAKHLDEPQPCKPVARAARATT